MSIFSIAAELGKAIKEDERMIRMEKAKEAYEGSEKIANLMMEYGIQQQALTTMGDGEDIDTDYTGTIATGSVAITVLGDAAAEGTQAKLDAVKAELQAGTLKVFDTSKFTVKNAKADTSEFSKAASITMDENGKLTSYIADVDDAGDYIPETQVIKTENGITFFAESDLRSAPYFDIIIDGITIGASVVAE